MSKEWQRLITTTVATMPRLGWRGRWDALRYASRWDKFLRTEEQPMTFSMYVKGAKEVDLTATAFGAQVEHGRTEKLNT